MLVFIGEIFILFFFKIEQLISFIFMVNCYE